MISVDRVTRKYGNFTAVDRISFELKPNEIVGFLGPNGSGKTTMLRVMTTYLMPTEGRVTIDGLDVVKDSLEVRRRIGYLPESNILYPQMRVDEYLTFVGRVRGLDGRHLKDRFDWCVQSLMLQDVLHKKTMECSKGYKQRVSLCAALIHDPQYIMLDEPTVGLDPLQIFMMRDFLRTLAQGKVILFSSHILQEVAAIAPRVLIIHGGRIIADAALDAQDNRTERLEKLFEESIRSKTEVAQ